MSDQADICSAASPITGQLCTMARGHAGPHMVGGPYHVVEEFVTKCAGQCEYHANSRRNVLTKEREEWLECIQCGHKIPRTNTDGDMIKPDSIQEPKLGEVITDLVKWAIYYRGGIMDVYDTPEQSRKALLSRTGGTWHSAHELGFRLVIVRPQHTIQAVLTETFI